MKTSKIPGYPHGRRTAIRSSTGERIYLVICGVMLTCYFFICLLPFYLIIINSLVPAMDLSRGGFQLWPQVFSLDGYRYVLGNGKVFTHYMVSITVTIVGTALACIVTAMFAYGLAHPRVKFRDAAIDRAVGDRVHHHRSNPARLSVHSKILRTGNHRRRHKGIAEPFTHAREKYKEGFSC